MHKPQFGDTEHLGNVHYDRGGDGAEAMAALLADARHVCGAKELDYSRVDARAYRQYLKDLPPPHYVLE